MKSHAQSPSHSIASTFAIALVVVGALATLSAAGLIAVTTILQRTTTEVASSVESVRYAEEAELNLLLLPRANDPVVHRELAGALRSTLRAAEQYVTSADEQAAFQNATTRVETYLREVQPGTPRSSELEADAFAALEQLVAVNLATTQKAREESMRWDRIANITGVALGVVGLAISTGLIVWLRRRVVKPWLALTQAVRSYGEGVRTQTDEIGPREVQEMSRSFNEMADRISAQKQAQLGFIAGVAHDLRTPLSTLQLAVDVIDPSEPLPPEPQLRRTVGVISRQICQMERMLGDFVDMSKSESGTLELHRDYHDLRRILGDVVQLMSQADATLDRIHVSMPRDPVIALCDDIRIAQVFTNLLSNALKYSPPERPVTVHMMTTASEVVVEVTDSGVGIAPVDHRRIFDPFQRVDPQAKTKGTGLGLFNVRRIVEAHGGRIEVESAPSRGSTFRMILRRASANENVEEVRTSSGVEPAATRVEENHHAHS